MTLSVPETRSPGPVLALDVIDDRAFLPRQEGRNDEADARAATGWGECRHVFRTVVSKVAKPSGAFLVPAAHINSTRRVQQARGFHVRLGRPPGGPVPIFGTLGQAPSPPTGDN